MPTSSKECGLFSRARAIDKSQNVYVVSVLLFTDFDRRSSEHVIPTRTLATPSVTGKDSGKMNRCFGVVR